MRIEHWDESWGGLSEENMKRRLEAEGYRVIRYDYPPGTRFPDHTHPFDKKDAVLSGQFLIRALGQEFLLGPGDMLEVPAGTLHSAEVIGDQVVISLDASKY
jgi:quercetin dioxygenase-like cupin family protein